LTLKEIKEVFTIWPLPKPDPIDVLKPDPIDVKEIKEVFTIWPLPKPDPIDVCMAITKA
jgi:hypothetical protein